MFSQSVLRDVDLTLVFFSCYGISIEISGTFLPWFRESARSAVLAWLLRLVPGDSSRQIKMDSLELEVYLR